MGKATHKGMVTQGRPDIQRDAASHTDSHTASGPQTQAGPRAGARGSGAEAGRGGQRRAEAGRGGQRQALRCGRDRQTGDTGYAERDRRTWDLAAVRPGGQTGARLHG